MKAYVLEFPGGGLASNRQIIDNCIMNQPTCSGAAVFIKWAECEPVKGQPNWSAIDERLIQWQNAGKKCALLVWAMDYNNPNGSTPQWVLDDPDVECVVCDYYGKMPIPYSDAYKQHYKDFMTRVMTKYGSAGQRVDYLRFGLGVGGETAPPCYWELMKLGNMNKDDFDITWCAFIDEMYSFVDAQDHLVRLDAPMNQYPGDNPRLEVCDWIADWADAHGGWSFGTQGLNQGDITAYANGQPTTSNWLANFEEHAGTPNHLQTKSATDPSNSPGGAGSLDTLAPFALQHGCKAFELYLQDWRIAYDPTYPGYNEYGAAYRAALEEIAGA